MTFTDAVKTGFRKYFTFSGRASRSEFWKWYLFALLLEAFVAYCDSYYGTGELFSGIAGLVMFCPSLAVMVRRCHDSGHSGLWMFCPFVNLLMVISRSDPFPNKYGWMSY